MRAGRVFYLVGRVLVVLGATMLLPLLCAAIYAERDIIAFAITAPLTVALGLAVTLICRKYRYQALRQRESFLFVSSAWLAAALAGALPYVLAGCFPDFWSCLFESVSGFTTTGASAMTDIEIMPHGILLWRSMTHWLGGAGIVLLFVALIQKNSSGGEGLSIYRAEYSGGALSERLAVRIEDNAKLIFLVYLGLTVICAGALLLGGMSFFDAVNHAMSTVSTGGFSTKNASIAAFDSAYIEWAVGIFLLLSGVNFSLYFLAVVRRRVRQALADEELRCYLLAAVLFTAVITWDLMRHDSFVGGFSECLRHAFFQVASLMTTGGFTSLNYDLWPDLARGMLFMLIFIGGCSGSTASGVKFSRWVLAGKSVTLEMSQMFRPGQVSCVKYNGHKLNANISERVLFFIVLYFALMLVGSILLAFTGMHWLEAFSISAASIGNVGPAIGSTGPAGNYAALTHMAKMVCSMEMLLGRLEIYTILVLCLPGVWRK